MNKTLIALCIVLTLVSCGTSKKVEKITKEYEKVIDSIKVTNTTNVIDTVEIIKDRVVTKPITQYIEVPIECDSLGNVKPISYNASSGSVNASFSIKDNKVVISTKIDSIVSYYEKEYRSKFVTDSIKLEQKIKEQYSKETTEKTKIVKYPWYWKAGIFLVAILLLAFIVWKVYRKFMPI